MSPADPAVAGVRDAGEGFPLLPAAGLHPRGLHSPPSPGETRAEISLMQGMFDNMLHCTIHFYLLSCTLLVNRLSSPRILIFKEMAGFKDICKQIPSC